MHVDEVALFERIVGASGNYLEFGAGGSTVVASALVAGRVVTVDSSREWLEAVATACRAPGRAPPRTVLVDLGPIGPWGRPTDPATRSRWPAYHTQIWDSEQAESFDTFMIDGRFRVACFLQVVLRAPPHATILIHDYASRPAYHVVEPFVRPVAAARDLAVFRTVAEFDRAAAAAVLKANRYNRS